MRACRYRVFVNRPGPLQYGTVRANYEQDTALTRDHPWARHVQLNSMSCGVDLPAALVEALDSQDPNCQHAVMIYVHGFNNSFDQAVARAAQASMAMRFHGPVLAFSWPSAGSSWPSAYRRDEREAALSNNTFQKVLLALADAVRGYFIVFWLVFVCIPLVIP